MADSSAEAPADPSASDAVLLDLVEDFTRRVRAGEKPDVAAFAARLPEREQEVRELLVTVSALERTEPDRASDVAPVNLTRIGGYRIEREIGRGGRASSCSRPRNPSTAAWPSSSCPSRRPSTGATSSAFGARRARPRG